MQEHSLKEFGINGFAFVADGMPEQISTRLFRDSIEKIRYKILSMNNR